MRQKKNRRNGDGVSGDRSVRNEFDGELHFVGAVWDLTVPDQNDSGSYYTLTKVLPTKKSKPRRQIFDIVSMGLEVFRMFTHTQEVQVLRVRADTIAKIQQKRHCNFETALEIYAQEHGYE